MRSYCRSTKAHNTVEIDGQDQCEFWDAFRVARRGYPRDVAWQPGDGGFRLSAWHDGYCRLAGAPRHQRQFDWHCAGHLGPASLEVTDRITASRDVKAVARLHLHWSCKIAKMSQNRVEITYPAGRLGVRFFGDGVLSSEQSFCCPEFGKRIAGTALAFAFSGSNTETGFRIEALLS